MIQPLRTVHRRTFIVLAGILPVILAVGLRARHHTPISKPETLTASEASNRLNHATARWEKKTFETEFYSDSAKPKTIGIILKPLFDLDEPDLLLYWRSQAGTDSSELTRAHLLGPFRPDKLYSLPAGTEHVSLILYSLAHREIVDTARLEGLP